MVDEKKLYPMTERKSKFMKFIYRLFRERLFKPRQPPEKARLGKGMSVVDYGCGTGRYTIPVAELVGQEGKVFAVDIYPPCIRTVKEKASRKGLENIEAFLIDGYNTGIQDSSIDRVLLIDVIQLVGDNRALLREIHRILKEDGFLYVDDPTAMGRSRAPEIIDSTGLFRIVEIWGQITVAVAQKSS